MGRRNEQAAPPGRSGMGRHGMTPTARDSWWRSRVRGMHGLAATQAAASSCVLLTGWQLAGTECPFERAA